MSELARALGPDEIRYATVWEDHRLVEEGLALRPGADVLSIGSAGDNVLALLLRGARRVVALDLNPAQTALLELKRAAIRRLDDAELLSLLGVARPRGLDPIASYERLRPALPRAARTFWDARTALLVEPGLLHCGRLERYFDGFRREHLAPLAPPALVDALLSARGGPGQAALFRRLATPELERAFVAYFGRENMARRGRHAAQLQHVPAGEDVGGSFWQRFRWACTALPADGNFYLEHFLRGGYRDPERGPVHLRRGALERLRALVDRIEPITEELETFLPRVAPGTFDGANLSDVFEYAGDRETAATLAAAARAVRRGGRICWWSLLVPRPAPAALRDRLRAHEALAAALSRHDRAWFYRAFHVEEVTA